MRTRYLLMVLALLGLVAIVASSAAAEGPRPPADFKDQIKSAVSMDGLNASSGSSSGGSPSHPTGRPPRVGFNRQVSRDQDPATVFRSGGSELTIAEASDGNLIVVGWNDGEGFGFKPFQPPGPPLGLSGYGFSSDGGKTFTDGGTPPFGTRSTPSSAGSVGKVVFEGPASFLEALRKALRPHAEGTGTLLVRRSGEGVLAYTGRSALRVLRFAYRDPARSLPRADRLRQALHSHPRSRRRG